MNTVYRTGFESKSCSGGEVKVLLWPAPVQILYLYRICLDHAHCTVEGVDLYQRTDKERRVKTFAFGNS